MSSNPVIPAERASDAGDASHRHPSLMTHVPGAAAGQPTHAQADTRVPAALHRDDIMLPPRGAVDGAGGPGGPEGPQGPAAPAWSPAIERPLGTRCRDAVQTLVWGVTASSAAVLVGAVPLACSLYAWRFAVSPFAFMPTLGVILAASVGMWVATQLGTAASIRLANRDARPHAQLAQAGQAARQTAALPQHDNAARIGENSAASSMLTLVDPNAQVQFLPAAAAHADGRPADFRSDVMPRIEGVEKGHGNMRQYMPTAPHASTPQPYVSRTRNIRNRHDFLQLLQSDGSGFNIIGLLGNPTKYDLWVWTVLDGLLVLTINHISMRWGGQWLTGLFVGAWNGFAMLGGETGFAHAGWDLALRTNGNINRSYRRSETVERAPPADATASGRLVHTDAATQARGYANNFATRFWDGQAEIFMRRDVARQAHHTLKAPVDADAAKQALTRENERTGVMGWLQGWKNKEIFCDQRLPSDALVPLALKHQSLEQGLERTTQYLCAVGQPNHLKSAAGTFLGKHTTYYHGRSLVLEALPADAPTALRVTFKDRDLQSRRNLLGFTSGMGFDDGSGTVAESEWRIEVGVKDEAAHAAIVALDQAMARAHDAEHERDTAAVAALRVAERALKDRHRLSSHGERTQSAQSVRLGDHRGWDLGARIPIVGSEIWSRRAPSGFAWSALSQRRDLHMDEHKCEVTTAPDGTTHGQSEQLAWAGRVVHASAFGPRGTRNTSLWAKVSDDGTAAKRSVLFESVWEMSRGNQYDYRDYVLGPLGEAFNISLPEAGHGSWRVQRSVRVSRQFWHDDPWLSADSALDEAQPLAPLQKSLRSFFERPSGRIPRVDAPQPVSEPARAVRAAFSTLFAAHPKEALPMLVSASGAKQPGAPGGPPPPPPAAPGWRGALAHWQVAVTTDALTRPKNALQAHALQPSPTLTVAECDNELARTDAAAALAMREPLASDAIKYAQVRKLARTYAGWQQQRAAAAARA